MHVSAPDGSSWNVTRRWAPWRPRWRRDDGVGDPGPGLFDADDPAALVLGLIVFLALLVLAPFIFPLIVGVLEIVLLVVLLPGAVLWRVAGRGQWEVEVRPARGRVFSGRPVHLEDAGGWRASRQRISDICAEIGRGEKRWREA